MPDNRPDKSEFFKKLAEQLYAAKNIRLQPLSQYEFDWRGIYRVELESGEQWVLRAVWQDRDLKERTKSQG